MESLHYSDDNSNIVPVIRSKEDVSQAFQGDCLLQDKHICSGVGLIPTHADFSRRESLSVINLNALLKLSVDVFKGSSLATSTLHEPSVFNLFLPVVGSDSEVGYLLFDLLAFHEGNSDNDLVRNKDNCWVVYFDWSLFLEI